VQKIEGSDGSTVGHKLLDQLKKLPTAKLLETLGDDALEIMKELEEELTENAEGGMKNAEGDGHGE